MTVLVVPALEIEPFPTLGPQVCDFIEECLVFGPGDVRGERARLDDETRGLIFRLYEVHPQGSPLAGRRRFKRAALSLRKGTAKTEKAAWIAAAELHPDGPVRCDGFDAKGEPVGVGVRDPYIPMVAYTEEQADELAFGALYAILAESPIADDFDIGLERIVRADGTGRAVPLAGAPNARDGARTTFQHFDESHRMVLPRLRAAHVTMLANMAKRKAADPWSLETTTAPVPGEGSVAEGTMGYAEQVAEGKITDSRLFFFHRQAGDGYDLDDAEQVRAAVIEASGPAAEWSDIDAIVDQFRDPQADRRYLERVWLNRPVASAAQAFDTARWGAGANPEGVIPDGAGVALGFDGSRTRDATAVVATDISTGFQTLIGLWEHDGSDGWEVPEAEVFAVVEAAFSRWRVTALYADPFKWREALNRWAGLYGSRKVIDWSTNRPKQAGYATRSYARAIAAGEVTHDGRREFTRHVGNAQRRETGLADDDGPLWILAKERPDSTRFIDAAMAALLSWEARGDAIAAGELVPRRRKRTFYVR